MSRARFRPPHLALLGGLIVLAGLVWRLGQQDHPSAPHPGGVEEGASRQDGVERRDAKPAEYVGTKACGPCHGAVLDAYRGSHHDRAIEQPSDASVLAPFEGETFSHDGVTTRFDRDGQDYVVRTSGADGKQRRFRVAYTFGVEPLQQYLLDAGGGRLQALTVAWDTRPEAQGGQRYFDLYPDDSLTPEHELHWTRPAQNWNFACADCHTTAFKKGYDAASDTFEPSWAELDVGCEACHGPGSNHIAWAKRGRGRRLGENDVGLLVALKRAQGWHVAAGAHSATPRSDESNLREVETCAPCHSRREQLREGRRPNEPFLDAYVPRLLDAPLYHADGQIDEEVYVYGSFLQSRMFHAGVRCSDCHDPHTLSLRRPGNALCTGCHDRATYDVVEHHHHEDDGSACVDCHMQERIYMQVDPRRDHSLRVPRPDLSAAIGVPDPCTQCHQGRSAHWAAARLEQWFGAPARPHHGMVLYGARQGQPGSAPKLAALSRDPGVPAIVRGTALALLARFPGEAATRVLRDAVSSTEPLLRLGVTQGARGLPQPQRVPLLLPLLSDPLLAVRTEATRALVGTRLEAVSEADRERLTDAYTQLLQVEQRSADRPEAWLRVALVELGQGKLDRAAISLERALALDRRFIPALVNLADLRRAQGNEEEAQRLLRRALGIDETSAEAWHALGLSLVRQKRLKDATRMLQRAVELQPDNPRFVYVYAVALADGDAPKQAIRALLGGLAQHPNERTLLQALGSYALQTGDRELASRAASALDRGAPLTPPHQP